MLWWLVVHIIKISKSFPNKFPLNQCKIWVPSWCLPCGPPSPHFCALLTGIFILFRGCGSEGGGSAGRVLGKYLQFLISCVMNINAPPPRPVGFNNFILMQLWWIAQFMYCMARGKHSPRGVFKKIKGFVNVSKYCFNWFSGSETSPLV